eukprot:GDKI01038761.1.p3 GENE.GDKI01038761.1~~GDKI01038761.1.p3  ORF type:complete len:137 (-),score=29.98 GDKI01038761.1:178-588(-)
MHEGVRIDFVCVHTHCGIEIYEQTVLFANRLGDVLWNTRKEQIPNARHIPLGRQATLVVDMRIAQKVTQHVTTLEAEHTQRERERALLPRRRLSTWSGLLTPLPERLRDVLSPVLSVSTPGSVAGDHDVVDKDIDE